MKQNLGKLDRIFRFVLGLWLVSAWGPKFFLASANTAAVVIGIWILFESFAGWCMLHDLLGINNKNQ